ncbi:MAG: hypothetical protein QXW91_05915, partial [Candidatus Nitrosotenuis sp.]
MKQSTSVLVSLIVIAVAATSFVIVSNLLGSCVGGPLGTCPSPYVEDSQASIEISGLKQIYNWKQTVEFTVVAHKFSGCATINVTILDEYESQPPLYQTSFITDCNVGTRIQPDDYVFPIVIPLNATEQGMYKAHVSYYQSRSSSGEIEQSFKVTKLSILEELLYSNSTEFTVALDAGSKGFFTVSGSINGAKLSDIAYDEYLNQIRVSLVESENGSLS